MKVEDVRNVISSLPPAQMSPDVKQLQDDLIQVTRDLAGAGDVATGDVNPEDASGRAILAVQRASQNNMSEQVLSALPLMLYLCFLKHLWGLRLIPLL